MLNLQWNHVSLYPAGYFTRRIPVQATATYTEGWTAVAGLPATKRGRDYVYEKKDYETLVDSPVFAARHYREWRLSDRADLKGLSAEPARPEAKPEQIEAHTQQVEQADKQYGAQQ